MGIISLTCKFSVVKARQADSWDSLSRLLNELQAGERSCLKYRWTARKEWHLKPSPDLHSQEDTCEHISIEHYNCTKLPDSEAQPSKTQTGHCHPQSALLHKEMYACRRWFPSQNKVQRNRRETGLCDNFRVVPKKHILVPWLQQLFTVIKKSIYIRQMSVALNLSSKHASINLLLSKCPWQDCIISRALMVNEKWTDSYILFP